MKKTRNIHTPVGIFVIRNVPFVLFAIVVVRPYAKETSISITFTFFSCKATNDELSRTNQLMKEIANLFVTDLHRNWQVKLKDT